MHPGNGVYIITEDGERYLNGELDIAEQDDSDNEGGPRVSV